MPRIIARRTSRRRGPSLITFVGLLGLLTAAAISLDSLQPTARGAAAFTVNSTGDAADSNTADGVCNDGTGKCTLRAAIQQANATPGADTINFSAAVTGMITPAGALPDLSTDINIQGPGANKLAVSWNGGVTYRILNIVPGATVTVSGLTISGGSSGEGTGGGILNGGTLHLIGSTVSGNNADFGGGIYNGSAAVANISGCTVNNNSARSGGGGIFNSSSGTVNVTNSTFSYNGSGDGGGGGVGGGVYNAGTLTITNSTVANNTAGFGWMGSHDGDGGGINSAGTTNVGNTVVADNDVSGTGRGPDLKGTFNSLDYNFIENTTGATVDGLTAHNITGQDPKLGPLQNNGGPTQTRLPAADSPVIDKGKNYAADSAGSPVLADQRGFTRPVDLDDASFPDAAGGDASDIGAVEFNFQYQISATAGTPQGAPVGTSFATQLQATVTSSGIPTAGVPVTFSAPASGPGGTFAGGARTATVNTDGSGVATAPLFTANATAGTYDVTVSLAGGSPSAVFILTNTATSSTAVASSVNPSAHGQAVTFTATVTSPGGTPAGTVQFKIDGANAGAAVSLDAGGVASFSTPGLTAGTHAVAADYSGGPGIAPSSGTLAGGQVVAGSVIEFTQARYTVAERSGSLTVGVRRLGDASQPTTVEYFTDDGSTPSVAQPCSATTGLALERCDYTRAAGTLSFAAGETQRTVTVLVGDDSYVEGAETARLSLSNPAGGAVVGSLSSATLEISDDAQESAGNPVDDNQNFVRQHYADLLNREPDPGGLAFWTDQMTNCGTPNTEVCRVNVSGAFFLSIEFQQTGYLVERIYKTAYGDATGVSTLSGPHTLAVPIVRYQEFLRDTQEIGRGIIVGEGDWQTRLENNKSVFALAFVRRQRFRGAYPSSLTADQFVTRLDAAAGTVLADSERAQLDLLFGGPNASSADEAKRAQALLQVAEHAALKEKEKNRAFVLMQYFGYLRRDPDAAPDSDHTGYDFWLRKLDEFGGNFVRAEMVKAFISSDEYRRRFGQ